MPLGRPKLAEPRVGVKVRIRKTLHGEVTLLLFDPVRGRVHYGDWTELMEHLLQRWVNEQKLAKAASHDDDTSTD